jgi:uncharacterized membrane protein
LVILFVAAVLTLYGTFIVAVVWAVLRKRRRAFGAGRHLVFCMTAVSMVLLPVISAVGTVFVLEQTENRIAVIISFWAVGAVLLGAGLLLASTAPSSWWLLLRLFGWSLIAGVALIPSFLVFLLPVPSLLAFLVPGGCERRIAAGRAVDADQV